MWTRAVGLCATSIATGLALVVVSAVAEPVGADPAPGNPDLTALVAAPAVVQVDHPFTISYTVQNIGTAPAQDANLEIYLDNGVDQPWHSVAAPAGCHFYSTQQPPFPGSGMTCALGTIAAGGSVTVTPTFAVGEAGTYPRRTQVYVGAGAQDVDVANDYTDYTVTVEPASHPGAGLGGLEALVADLLALLHL